VTDIDDLRGPEVVARIKKAGGEASFWHHDVTSEERWIEVVADVMKRYGRLDVLSRTPASAFRCRRSPR
jgi:NAD(P)-dependent dehydrogenase (short-subunit alcohol dehydrogenase family)